MRTSILAAGRALVWRDSADHIVDFVRDMVQDESGRLIFGLDGLPWVDHDPVGSLIAGELTHAETYFSSCQYSLR